MPSSPANTFSQINSQHSFALTHIDSFQRVNTEQKTGLLAGEHELHDLGGSSTQFDRKKINKTHRPSIQVFAGNRRSTTDESENDTDNEQMGKRDRSKGKVSPARSTSSNIASPNGNMSGAMNGLLEQRRKHASIDSPTSTSRMSDLVGRHSFTLDDPVPTLTHDPNATSKGFSELPEHDRRNFLLLVLLYFLQGIPMGLATGSVPFLLKPHVSYSQVGVFSLASYPYSLKLLWSPIVDAVWSTKVGRRKSWILPIQTLSGFGMLWLGSNVERMMKNAESQDGSGVWGFTWWWFSLVFMCATQDIAVDGTS